MERGVRAACAAVALAAAIAIPTIAFGNARHNAGSLRSAHVRATVYVATLAGPAELTATTPAGDRDGVGAAAVTFDLTSTPPTVCWDLTYSGIVSPPTFAHIHRGAAGVAGPILIPFVSLGANSATGCRDLVVTPKTDEIAVAMAVVANPSEFYVNVHTTEIPSGAMRGQVAVGPPPGGEAHLLPAPLRAYDSRDAAGPKILAGETRTISLATATDLAGTSLMGVPPGATAAIVTLTVTETSVELGGSGGFLKLYSAASPEPATSSINWAGADQNMAVSTQLAVDASGQVKVTAGANATHFVIDIIGYLF